jgi:hypothetical protein
MPHFLSKRRLIFEGLHVYMITTAMRTSCLHSLGCCVFVSGFERGGFVNIWEAAGFVNIWEAAFHRKLE